MKKLLLAAILLSLSGCATLAELDPQNVIANKVAPAVIKGLAASIQESYGSGWGTVAIAASAAATAVLGSYAGTRRRGKKS
jgi:uncharacterized protein YceK